MKLLVALYLVCAAWSDEADPSKGPRCVQIEVFGRKGATNSDAATNFVSEIAKQRDGIVVEINDISADSAAETRAKRLLRISRTRTNNQKNQERNKNENENREERTANR